MARFCKYCGRSLQDGEVCQCRDNGMATGEAREKELAAEINTPKAIGIVNIVAGSLMLLLGLNDIEFAWGLFSLAGGAGFLVSGILELVKRNYKIIGIIQISLGGLTALGGVACDLEFDWAYIGILIGAAFVAVGVLRLLQKSIKVISIVEIVFASVLLLLAFANIEFNWGWIALASSGALMTSGILFFVYNRAKAE